MLNHIKTKQDEGFTIIEVMIVLAVAALILLIVLLAVPALQRSSRNTTIKNDASTLAGAISTFENDNNGTIPTTISGQGSTVTISAGVGVPETANLSSGTSVSTNGTLNSTDKVGSIVTNVRTSTISAQIGQTCPAFGSAYTSSNNSTRSVALYYVIETSSGNALQCTQA